jgi:hypothetical protein
MLSGEADEPSSSILMKHLLEARFRVLPSLAVIVQSHLHFVGNTPRDALFALRGLPSAFNFPLSASSSLLVTVNYRIRNRSRWSCQAEKRSDEGSDEGQKERLIR